MLNKSRNRPFRPFSESHKVANRHTARTRAQMIAAKKNYVGDSVADGGCLSLIRDTDFFHLGSRIHQQQKGGEKLVVTPFLS